MVFTSHYDHFGTRDPQPGDKPDTDRIFNGAYDNASGCAGQLMIAQAMARAGQKPARSMYFVFTTAEESGLLGAEYYAQHPLLPMDQVAANINIDGINYLGTTSDIVLLGADRSIAGADGGGAGQGARPHARRRSASGTRLLLPIGSLSRSPRPACRRCRSASRASSSAPTRRS